MALIRGTVTGDSRVCPPPLLSRLKQANRLILIGGHGVTKGDNGWDKGDGRCHTNGTYGARIKRPPEKYKEPLLVYRQLHAPKFWTAGNIHQTRWRQRGKDNINPMVWTGRRRVAQHRHHPGAITCRGDRALMTA